MVLRAGLLALVASGLACGGSSITPAACEGAATEACAIENGTGERTRSCDAGSWSEWGACARTGCDEGYVPLGEAACVPGTVAVTVAPPAATLQPGATQQFTATVTGTANTAVTWAVEEASDCGGVDASSGVYTAPGMGPATCHVRATSVADSTRSGTATVSVTSGAATGAYPFEGYTLTRGAFEAIPDGQGDPVVLIVDSLDGGSSGDETTGRGTLRWALTRSYPRVILFETSGTIHLDDWVELYSPYLSVYGQTAPSPGITLYGAELIIRTHDVILQHLRIRMGDTMIGMGDPLNIAGDGTNVHDIIVDHCSIQLGKDELVDLTSTYGDGGSVNRVTLSNNILSHAVEKDDTVWHNYALLIESGDSNNNMGVDEILVNGNLFSQVADRTPLINFAARRVTVTNNIAYNLQWNGLLINSQQFPEGMNVDFMNNLYWRGPRTESPGSWPTDESATWPSQPEVWSWDTGRRPTAKICGPAGSNTHVYYSANYQYVNGTDDYDYHADHRGRPISLADERYDCGPITYDSINHTSRVTSVSVTLKTPIELEDGLATVGASQYRDDLDALAVDTAVARNGDWVHHESDLGVPAYPAGAADRALTSLPGYPGGHELADTDGDGLTDLENWIYALYP